ncbi:TPA: helix-turn-helix domain-containing protein [Pseudomonas aeruginosa]|uniref:helix-turn-helix domain-containing protein n=1 Tax=Pseudomonas aeruginosa TaxID=287 RepID=UPI00163C5BA7|nr:helix-turn-helix domain-containing protein [Pseudomonas aeruginosa]HBO4520306.1 helix-turn-helix domain-containing protein [Pseudomonas aeruginosa]HBO6310308.1 helix-turn-helix domain-containing protein [Pseudomonas aeruginosa]
MYERKNKLPEIHCKNCRLSKACRFNLMPEAIVELLEKGFAHNQKFRKGECLFRQGAPATSVFIILSGALKATLNTGCGEEIITGFHFPGEMLGLSSMGAGIYLTSALALETAFTCRLAYSRLLELSRESPDMQAGYMSLVANEIRAYQDALVLTKKMIDTRLAGFLINISKRNYANGLSASQLHLAMTQQDIGRHLDMAIESVSRAFSRLQRSGYIVIHGKDIYIPNIDSLCHFAAK